MYLIILIVSVLRHTRGLLVGCTQLCGFSLWLNRILWKLRGNRSRPDRFWCVSAIGSLRSVRGPYEQSVLPSLYFTSKWVCLCVSERYLLSWWSVLNSTESFDTRTWPSLSQVSHAKEFRVLVSLERAEIWRLLGVRSYGTDTGWHEMVNQPSMNAKLTPRDSSSTLSPQMMTIFSWI